MNKILKRYTLVAYSYSCHLLYVLRDAAINEFGSVHETGVTKLIHRHFISKVVVDLLVM